MENVSRRELLIRACCGTAAIPAVFSAIHGAPAPFGALPSSRQLRWHQMELYAFLHFSINTFTDREWGNGDEDPALFNPASFDPAAIVATLKAGGMTGVILTCKHHDGFCLWPTRTTGHSVSRSSWRNGKGDVVRELSDAARAEGLRFGIYLSPWDRNSALYGTPGYVDMYREQLRELLTGYGPIFEVWHDGANGGDGFYGGAKEKRVIDKRTYYDWPRTWDLVRSLQPDAVIFSDVGPDIRWVGNENGIAGETCWATYDPVGEDGGPPAPGYVRASEGETGTRDGSRWMPAECDVSIRPGWFWHAAESNHVKTPSQLMDLYGKSVGRGASFLLNVPPDRRGLLDENDSASLRKFGELLRAAFATNLAATANVESATVRHGNRRSFGPRNLVDGNRDTSWSTDDSVTAPEVMFTFAQPIAFNLIRLREDIRLGQRVEAFALDQWKGGGWSPLAEGTSIGACRILRLPEQVTSARVRLRVLRSPVCPALSEFGLYMEPAIPA